MTGRWHVMRVTIPPGDDPVLAATTLRRVEAWLAAHHRPVALFSPAGKPRSPHVCFAAPAEQAEKALAFRMFCRELGLEGRIVQWRIDA